LDADTENEINKIRWERWRAKQKTEREKTCFYCWDNWGEVSYHCGNSRGCPHGCADVGVELSYDVENCSVDAYDVAGFCLQGGHDDLHCGNTFYGRLSGEVLAVNYICSPPCEGWSCDLGEKECYYWCAGLKIIKTCPVPLEWCGYDMQNYASCTCHCGLAGDGCSITCTAGP